jgi:dTDP-4-dehydrorhamnose reductase
LLPLSHTQLDITRREDVVNACQHHRPDVVINAAAYTKVDLAETETELAYLINATGAANLAEVCHALNIPLIHFCTDYVFDGESSAQYTETDTPSPLNVYGASKLQGENLVRQHCEKHIILRVSWVFGAYGANFVKTMLRLAREKTELRIVDDQRGGPTPTISIADAVSRILQYTPFATMPWGTYHFCGTPVVSWCEFAQQIIAIARNVTELKTQRVMPITSSEYPTAANRPKNSALACEKITATFGIQPADWLSPLNQFIESEIHASVST